MFIKCTIHKHSSRQQMKLYDVGIYIHFAYISETTSHMGLNFTYIKITNLCDKYPGKPQMI